MLLFIEVLGGDGGENPSFCISFFLFFLVSFEGIRRRISTRVGGKELDSLPNNHLTRHVCQAKYLGARIYLAPAAATFEPFFFFFILTFSGPPSSRSRPVGLVNLHCTARSWLDLFLLRGQHRGNFLMASKRFFSLMTVLKMALRKNGIVDGYW